MGLSETGDRVAVTALDPATVGGWRTGRLSYTAAPLAAVAADLGRSIGVPVRAAPEVAARPFTGVIMLDPDRDLLFRRVAALLGVRAVRTADGWTLIPGEPR
ncbi:hypothetical protein GVO57_06005 [Sphingomonas changnyeongensis]|uniref:Uncharacterized protein n=1 Tax=Sphingomonas changnyeongensis TaxID=2698679 RepID=A0A7Z2NWE1_9SPHN|nr:hypothetical protein [Sphingomonas changnyeongensis]QHL90469.1 hypothetical protein GVO57_06005 [Sphingomonas changnyeongensis]